MSALPTDAGTSPVHVERVAQSLVARATILPVSTLHEASGKRGALPWEIKPLSPAFRLCGPALTVHAPGGDNLWLHRAIYAAEPGDVLVVHVSGAYGYGYWGEIMSAAASARKLAGLVIDGCVRDGSILKAGAFPVFARGLAIRGTGKDFGARGWIGEPVLLGDVIVQSGELIAADEDGVVAIAREDAATVIDAAERRESDELRVLEQIAQGRTTLQIYGLERP